MCLFRFPPAAMPIVTLFCDYVQCSVLLLYFCWHKGLHRDCWPVRS
jgi:hypothetical protein